MRGRRVEPTEGQESVWDYPRPPRLEPFAGMIEVRFAGVRVVRASRAWRVLETSHPPNYYLPVEEFAEGVLRRAGGGSWCEWKGRAVYWDLQCGEHCAPMAAWSYPEPTAAFAPIAGHIALYAGRVDEARVDGEIVVPQPGEFYGGWITSKVVGPFKGEPGTAGW